MTQSTMEAYAEVDTILSFMDEKYINEIPEKLRKIIRDKKSKDYKKIIVADKPLEEQNLKNETLSMLAVLNYNYWCKDTERKRQLINIYSNNEKLYQEKLKEKYNPNDIFKNHNQNEMAQENTVKEEVAMVEYKETLLKKIINKIKVILHIK